MNNIEEEFNDELTKDILLRMHAIEECFCRNSYHNTEKYHTEAGDNKNNIYAVANVVYQKMFNVEKAPTGFNASINRILKGCNPFSKCASCPNLDVD